MEHAAPRGAERGEERSSGGGERGDERSSKRETRRMERGDERRETGGGETTRRCWRRREQANAQDAALGDLDWRGVVEGSDEQGAALGDRFRSVLERRA